MAATHTVFAGAKRPMALFVMLDGMRADAVVNAYTPNMKMLMDGKWQPGYKCAWTLSASTIRDAITVSAPNHVSLMTGVTAAKTNTRNNGQIRRCDFSKWQSWLVRVLNARPGSKGLFMFSWNHDKYINPDPRVEMVEAVDEVTAAALPKRLAAADCPDSVLWFYNGTDHGETYGFYPYAPGTFYHVFFADRTIGEALRAIASRPTFDEEDWIVVITSDHGGYHRYHGPMSAHCWTVPVLISSRNVSQGRIPGMSSVCDPAVTVIDHFGVDTSKMDLDGKVLGKNVVASEPVRKLTDGLVAYLPFEGKKAENLVASGPVAKLHGRCSVAPLHGFILGHLHLRPDANGPTGVELKGSEKLAFENGGDFTMTVWVRMGQRQDGDPVIAGNKDWSRGTNPGIAMVGFGRSGDIQDWGVTMNGALKGENKRFDIGPYDIPSAGWTFYAATRGPDGVLSFYQGGVDGFLYRIVDDATQLNIQTGLPFFIGQDGTGRYPKTLNGDIDDFALWTRGLSHEDIRKIYESGRNGIPLGELL